MSSVRETMLRSMLELAVDAMRRCDPDYAKSHGLDQISDEEWDDVIAEIEDTLESVARANCDACDQRPYTHMVIASGIEAAACDECVGEQP